jgi:hypothetical protein
MTRRSCSNASPENGGRPRQRRKTGRSGMSNGATTLAGATHIRPSKLSSITSAETLRSISGRSKHSSATCASIRLASASGSGRSTITRDGCRPPSPVRTSAACCSQSGGTQAMCVSMVVRSLCAWSSCSAWRRSAIACSTCAIETPSPDHSPEIAISVSARRARRERGARPPQPVPKCRRDSLGSWDDRVARPPRSRRRAPTAPRSRRSV